MASKKDRAAGLEHPPTIIPGRSRTKRTGAPSSAEKALVAQVVADNGNVITGGQKAALVKLLRRDPKTVERMILEARDEFNQSALDYVRIHREATNNALAAEDNETAIKASQWAIEKIGDGKNRVVDTAKAGPSDTGTKIMIGIKLGGLRDEADPPPPDIEIESN